MKLPISCSAVALSMSVPLGPGTRALVMLLLLDGRMSQREIARCCKVSLGLVAKIKKTGPAGLCSKKPRYSFPLSLHHSSRSRSLPVAELAPITDKCKQWKAFRRIASP
jgi:hypothetical protein